LVLPGHGNYITICTIIMNICSISFQFSTVWKFFPPKKKT
jgi:hypothetical protein